MKGHEEALVAFFVVHLRKIPMTFSGRRPKYLLASPVYHQGVHERKAEAAVERLKIDTWYTADRTVLDFAGSLNPDTLMDFRVAVDEALSTRRTVFIHLERLLAIDAVGPQFAAILLDASERARCANRQLSVVSASSIAARQLSGTRLAPLLQPAA